ncbi:threonine--tRNA ligase [candidate division WWE3 bacterium RIFCSPHIGHO2_12_FULL_38_15]|uniref:Threonine--tRNA ligase n=1 Tax=candidate division WWE3 bacterium RIFCSPHIGHO2_02_FULL_38_14 TaxID=1802620 RepID=A0A1F4V9X3_UNCKA|nr:MAG: threonine--tRNA ligase [candidate division WWE3 bacterium RIFCSPHIGHO2_01_FULL_38_45]OGC48694.1 MAG: threonine--tRNA ligase [candidate division WWE3 bacterium RIFCSPHIGHO2_12_FULL_38_15]OGC53100.1 MAG: threonine--tRNA ligase [candidate division WWE3 bacterium RIFCSPLOWO2_01_FULL_37_24]OGC53463.1 MAG: threonine--tRNA ligase [candidate division WWE3 bacterium RIFCSPHIGHO2_02_FULL_38_14]HLB51938.1 threonine--tRNA ligase [Patescibacteria group bacterium]
MSKVKEELENDPLMPLRHTAEHVLHLAMQELYPSLKKAMGPPIEEGFYFDFDLDEKVSSDDFVKIEKRMQELIDADLPVTLVHSSVKEAKDIFKDNPFKLEWLQEIHNRGEEVTLYEMGEKDGKHYDLDLCAGPHARSTGEVKAFKLLSVAGAYWKGNEKNKMLTRIYGTAFDTKEKLEKYLKNLEEQKKRDHRKLGQELELFTFSEEVGPGLPLWTPKGNVIREELEKWAKDTEKKLGYMRVATPHIAKHTLFEISGHLPYYRDDMYNPMDIEGEEYFLKGMNCPHHHMIFKSKPKSYKDLPLRYAEYGMVYRFEQSGTLFGLMRVRAIQQNDAHIYCTLEQAEDEFLKVLELHEFYYNTLGLTKDDYYIAFGLPDTNKKEKYHGDKATWDKAEELMRKACKRSGIRSIDDVGGAAFYGPKTDFTIRSSTGREFAISTNQLDLFMPQRFNLEYTDKDGSKKLCVVIHRAPLGSHERFIGFLIEHFGGAFPVWLSPVQVQIIPISEKQIDYAIKLQNMFIERNLRAEVDDRSETIQAKIRDAQLQKIPYMLVVGDREVQNNEVSVRLRTGEDLKAKPLTEVLAKIEDIYLTKSLKLW